MPCLSRDGLHHHVMVPSYSKHDLLRACTCTASRALSAIFDGFVAPYFPSDHCQECLYAPGAKPSAFRARARHVGHLCLVAAPGLHRLDPLGHGFAAHAAQPPMSDWLRHCGAPWVEAFDMCILLHESTCSSRHAHKPFCRFVCFSSIVLMLRNTFCTLSLARNTTPTRLGCREGCLCSPIGRQHILAKAGLSKRPVLPLQWAL